MIGKTADELNEHCFRQNRNRTAVIFGSREMTYGDLQTGGVKLTHALVGAGIRRGDKMAMILPNCPECFFLDIACAKLGLAKIPVAPYLQLEDMIFILQDAEAKVILYHETFRPLVDRIKQEFPDLLYIYHGGDADADAPQADIDLKQIMARGSTEPFASEATEDDLIAIVYTGGTTGKPKGVAHSQRTLVAMAYLLVLETGIEEEARLLVCSPLTHGAGAFILPTFLRSGSVVVLSGFDPQQFLRTIQEQKATTSFIVPSMLYKLLEQPNLKDFDISSMSNFIYGASPIAPSRLKEAVEVMGPVFTQIYGQTEAPAILTVLSKREHLLHEDGHMDKRLTSCGRPISEVTLKLCDDDGDEVPLGEPGEIVARAPHMMLEYWKRPDLTAQTIRDGWLYTGDVARMDEDGLLYIVDRKKEMIISGGFNVFPKEIEDTLMEHPEVRMAVVIGVPHEKWGESVKAVVVLRNGKEVTEEALIQYCKDAKGKVMAPKTVDFVDNIPLTPVGKPDKKAVRTRYWRGQERLVG